MTPQELIRVEVELEDPEDYEIFTPYRGNLQTGRDMFNTVWVGIMIVSALLMIILWRKKKEETKEEDKDKSNA